MYTTLPTTTTQKATTMQALINLKQRMLNKSINQYLQIGSEAAA